MLPIPKNITASIEERDKRLLNSTYYWSTKDFVNHHYFNLKELFLDVIDRCIQIESRDLIEPVKLPENFIEPLMYFPTKSAENGYINKVRFYNPESVNDW